MKLPAAKRTVAIAAAAAALGLAASSAHAAAIVDQQNLSTNTTVSLAMKNGQSFIPTLTGIDFAEFQIGTDGTSSTIHLELLSGAGIFGTSLGKTPSQTFPDTGTVLAHFEFESTISLTPGDPYTLALVLDQGGGDTFRYSASNLNPYPHGEVFDNGGDGFPDFDFVFAEGLNVAAVPEPFTLALLGVALAGLGWSARRTRAS